MKTQTYLSQQEGEVRTICQRTLCLVGNGSEIIKIFSPNSPSSRDFGQKPQFHKPRLLADPPHASPKTPTEEIMAPIKQEPYPGYRKMAQVLSALVPCPQYRLDMETSNQSKVPVVAHHFKMETIRKVKGLIEPGD